MKDNKRLNTNGWRVVLIGGNSGAGKTYVTRELVQQLGVSFLMVDDIRIALHQVTTQTQQPDLHVFLNYQPEDWRNPDKIFEDWLRVGTAMIKPLKAIIAHHIVVPDTGRIIIEGDGILPSLALQSTFSDLREFTGLNIKNEIRAVFLVENDEAIILDKLRKRGRGFNESSQEEQKSFAHASWLYGKWLRKEAEVHSLPVLYSQPKKTVIEHFLEIILE
jgi:2-phosphoglycerate kinase